MTAWKEKWVLDFEAYHRASLGTTLQLLVASGHY